jgi:p70 ribosomal S6 kinase
MATVAAQAAATPTASLPPHTPVNGTVGDLVGTNGNGIVRDALDVVDIGLSTAVQRSCTLQAEESAIHRDEDFETFKDAAKSLKVPRELHGGKIRMETSTILDKADLESFDTFAALAANSHQPSPSESQRDNKLTMQSHTESFASALMDPHVDKSKRYVSPKDFDLLKVIGMGAFGKVLQVRNRQTSQVLAMKIISKRLLRRKQGYVENVQAERNILTKVRHPFVVTMHCSFQTKEKLFIIMDFLAGGELFLRLGREGIFLEKTAEFYLAEIILALDHLHVLGILHRDLKPENILLGSDGHVCLTDFGLAKDFGTEGFDEESSRALTVCGTQEYMAPEMVARQGYSRAADYWSLGCIAYEMMSGLPPFQRKRNEGSKDLFRKIMSEKVKMPVGSSSAACKLLKGLLNRNVQARLGAAKSSMFEVGGVAGLKKADFFQSIEWNKLERKEVEPPQTLAVQNDQDLKHFHDEFTQMSLPRSVVEMTNQTFCPRRVDSDVFRGFSFVQDDFRLPERGEGEVDSYWQSIEEDGESVSECASSKMGMADETETPVVKKRPPRKRKKKVDNGTSEVTKLAASTLNSPSASQAIATVSSAATSRAKVPVPLEVGDYGKNACNDEVSCLRQKGTDEPTPDPTRPHSLLSENLKSAILRDECQTANPGTATEIGMIKSDPRKDSWQAADKVTTGGRKQKVAAESISNAATFLCSGGEGAIALRDTHTWTTAPPRTLHDIPGTKTAGWSKVPISSARSMVSTVSPSSDWRQHQKSPQLPARAPRQPPTVASHTQSAWPSLASTTVKGGALSRASSSARQAIEAPLTTPHEENRNSLPPSSGPTRPALDEPALSSKPVTGIAATQPKLLGTWASRK